MLNLNKIFVVGNLTRDPEKSMTQSGTPVCTLRVAVNRKIKSGEAVCFFDVSVWGKQAGPCAQYLKKGEPVLIEGHMAQDVWTDKNTGKERSKYWLVAESVQFLNRKKPEQSQQDRYSGNWDAGQNVF